ncbi:MAG: hypothetical protein LBQ88_11945, partial [Treponema sp.]|nr:hypothetical protein [Treponema sp.]
ACFRSLQGINIHKYEYLYRFMREAPSSGSLWDFSEFSHKHFRQSPANSWAFIFKHGEIFCFLLSLMPDAAKSKTAGVCISIPLSASYV